MTIVHMIKWLTERRQVEKAREKEKNCNGKDKKEKMVAMDWRRS